MQTDSNLKGESSEIKLKISINNKGKNKPRKQVNI